MDLTALAKEYGPVIARYVAAGVVALLAAALAHFKINLDPATSTALTTGLGGVFLGIIYFGAKSRKDDRQATVDNTVHAAITGEVAATVAAKASTAQLAAIEASPVASIAPVVKPPVPAV